MAHSPEPWDYTKPGPLIVSIDPDDDPNPPSMIYGRHPDMDGYARHIAFKCRLEDAERIVACVNFCRQFDSEFLNSHVLLKITGAKNSELCGQSLADIPNFGGLVACALIPVSKEAANGPSDV